MPLIWTFVEQDGDAISTLGRELLTKARSLGDSVAILLGQGSPQIMAELGEYGATSVWQAETGDRLPAAPLAAALAAKVASERPDLLLFGQAYSDRDVAGRLAARLGVSVLSNAIDVRLGDGAVETDHEIAGGSQVATASSAARPAVVLVRPKSFPDEPSGGPAPVVERLEVPDVGQSEATIVAVHEADRDDVPLGAADVIVAGGLGLGSAAAYEMIDRLGRLLGGATGATRAIVDAGWVPYAKQIGQTGETVKPKAYIGCGISGAIQHAVGMKDSKLIIAINKDPEAPIFRLADLGIVGDVHQVIPRLISALEARRG